MQHVNRTKDMVDFCGPVNSDPCPNMKQPITSLNIRPYRAFPNTLLKLHHPHLKPLRRYMMMIIHNLDFSFFKSNRYHYRKSARYKFDHQRPK